ncbi:molybdenum cofactor guanylyltransferase [Salisediminibacterium selenitireducens]|uniref:Probable molybdenum cofactor guanylyltransferase n=1 Tax=Bacillus selenitireducens (strain ATCC 700615 / DSM 15326 / MLS10) TaxID=439292 RepID=D6XSE9_BACIE|nr:molybdenum cofactor guanylyltransferase [Salisediminibacterium selenitireducens]ADH98735.1 formate dehydrogenase accessory protein FdhD [[Bacillus] selenitireducens MLS10]
MGITGIILAGGQSRRMGQNKALLPVGDETNIGRIKRLIEARTDDQLLVTNDPDSYEFLQIPMFEDEHKGHGPLAGIEVALRQSTTTWNLIVACDMPFVDGEIARFLCKKAKEEGALAAVPEYNGKRHPLFACYHKDFLPYVTEALDQGEKRMINVLDQVKTVYISEDDMKDAGWSDAHLKLAFYNMNHPEDYEWVQTQNV